MSNAETITRKVHIHTDGGTFTVIASAQTRNRWAITITDWTTYKGQHLFEVNRETPDAKLFRLGYFSTEAEARAYANKMYRHDR